MRPGPASHKRRAGPAHGPRAFCGWARAHVVGPMEPVLCPMSYVLCPMSCVLCPTSYVICPMSCVLRPVAYVQCPMSYGQGILL